ncbi:MAG: hypothetical protein RL346_1389 [Verrucomicrobiota bacterium]
MAAPLTKFAWLTSLARNDTLFACQTTFFIRLWKQPISR